MFNARENDEDSRSTHDADAARRADIYKTGAALVREALRKARGDD